MMGILILKKGDRQFYSFFNKTEEREEGFSEWPQECGCEVSAKIYVEGRFIIDNADIVPMYELTKGKANFDKFVSKLGGN